MSRLVDILVHEGAFCTCDLKVTRKQFYKVFNGKNTIHLIDGLIDRLVFTTLSTIFSHLRVFRTYGVIFLEENFVETFI